MLTVAPEQVQGAEALQLVAVRGLARQLLQPCRSPVQGSLGDLPAGRLLLRGRQAARITDAVNRAARAATADGEVQVAGLRMDDGAGGGETIIAHGFEE